MHADTFSDLALRSRLAQAQRQKSVSVGQPIAGRVVVSRWLSKFNFSTLSMS